MTKKMVKAIRLVNGFNDDLRVKIPYSRREHTQQAMCIRNFLFDHAARIFGPGIYETIGIKPFPQPGTDSEDCYILLQYLDKQARAICLGEYDGE